MNPAQYCAAIKELAEHMYWTQYLGSTVAQAVQLSLNHLRSLLC